MGVEWKPGTKSTELRFRGTGVGQYRAMIREIIGNCGVPGNVESVTYRRQDGTVGSSPTPFANLPRSSVGVNSHGHGSRPKSDRVTNSRPTAPKTPRFIARF